MDGAVTTKDGSTCDGELDRNTETKCTVHLDMTVEYYCKDHDFLGCMTCFTTGHTNCHNTESISDIPEDFEKSDYYKSFTDKLKTLSQNSRDVIQIANYNIRRAGLCCRLTVQGIRHRREEINQLFDNIENNLIKQAEVIKADDIQVMVSSAGKAKSVLKNVENITSKTKSLESSRNICQLYVTIKHVSSEIQCMVSSLEEAENTNIRLYHFEPTSILKEMYTFAEAYGNIRFRQNDRTLERRVLEDTQSTTATYISDIVLRSDTSSFHWLTGSAVFPGNRLIVVDYCNTMVSLINTDSNKLISDLKVDDRPWDVCTISANQAAITISGDQTILFLNITGVMSVERKISVNGKCCGIAYNCDRLYVAFIEPPKFEIMDLEGTVIKTIENDINGYKIFKWPQYICLSREKDMIYISDSSTNKIMRMTLSGQIKSEFTFRKWSTPCKVCIDQQGNVYVACHSSRNIQMLTAECSEIKVLLAEANGLNNDVQSISHLHETNRLVIGMYGSREMKVLQLE